MSPVGASKTLQLKVRDYFAQLPDSIVPYLSTNNRLDMLDFWDSNMKMEVKNNLDGHSQLMALSDKSLTVQFNEASRLEMVLLDTQVPVDSASQLICLIRTLGTDICESTVSFYSVRWRPLPVSDYLPMSEGVCVAVWQDDSETLTLTDSHALDRPANEEQKLLNKTLTTLKWNGETFNKY